MARAYKCLRVKVDHLSSRPFKLETAKLKYIVLENLHLELPSQFGHLTREGNAFQEGEF